MADTTAADVEAVMLAIAYADGYAMWELNGRLRTKYSRIAVAAIAAMPSRKRMEEALRDLLDRIPEPIEYLGCDLVEERLARAVSAAREALLQADKARAALEGGDRG